jgi:hypothetical protein
LGCKSDRQSALGAPDVVVAPWKSVQSSEQTCACTQSSKKQINWPSGTTRPQAYQTGSKSVLMPFPQSGRGDTSKLTCYKCGKVGHIATDTKCPQYKKPV